MSCARVKWSHSSPSFLSPSDPKREQPGDEALAPVAAQRHRRRNSPLLYISFSFALIPSVINLVRYVRFSELLRPLPETLRG